MPNQTIASGSRLRVATERAKVTIGRVIASSSDRAKAFWLAITELAKSNPIATASVAEGSLLTLAASR